MVLLGVVPPESPITFGSSVYFQWLSPAIGFLLLGLSLQFWKLGVRHYRSTGS